MNKLTLAAAIALLATNFAMAQTAAPAAADKKAAAPAMEKKAEEKKADAGNCESKAVSKDGKPLAGAAKSASIKKCERESKAAEGKKANTSQQDKMKSCNKDAGGKKLKGDERKKFMSDCLKG